MANSKMTKNLLVKSMALVSLISSSLVFASQVYLPIIIPMDDINTPIPVEFDSNEFKFFYGDFNGDGIEDVLVQPREDSGTTYIYLGDGTGKYFSIHQTWTGQYLGQNWGWENYEIQSENVGGKNKLIDMNGDGRADIYIKSAVANGRSSIIFASTSGQFEEVFLSFNTPAFNTEPIVITGRIAGAGQVTPSGEATYSIPFSLPPAPGNFKPDLGLTYGHRQGTGIAGHGWHVTGTSMIHRCPKNRATDGVSGNISFTNNDRLCLDGQRLIRTNGGNYGNTNDWYWVDGAIYSTEIESFVRIYNRGNSYFEVHTPDTLISYYGNTANSKVRVDAGASSPVRVWALDTVNDRVGNSYKYHYEKSYNSYYDEAPAADFYLNKITYGNVAVQFLYDPRMIESLSGSNGTKTVVGMESVLQYSGGYPVRNKRILNKVQTKVAGAIVKEYRFTYDSLTGGEQRSLRLRLKQLEECSGHNECLLPTTFTYSNSTPAWTEQDIGMSGLMTMTKATGGRPVTETGGTTFADLNGDGYTDVLSISAKDTGNVLTNDFNYSGSAPDINKELLYGGPNGLTPASFPNILESTPITVDGYPAGKVVDINNDGLPDICHLSGQFNTSSYSVYRHHGDCTVRNGTSYHLVTLPTDHDLVFTMWRADMRVLVDAGTRVADLNGDGIQDVIRLYNYHGWGDPNSPQVKKVWLGTGDENNPFVYNATYSNSLPEVYFVAGYNPAYTELADVNGDGLPDLVRLRFGVRISRAVYLNTGTTFVHDTTFSNSLPDAYFGYAYDMGTRIADLNGDGNADLIQIYDPLFNENSASHYGGVQQKRVFLSTGKEFVESLEFAQSIFAVSGAKPPVDESTPQGELLLDRNYKYYFANFAYGYGKSGGYRLMDVDNNGLPDLVLSTIATYTATYDYGNKQTTATRRVNQVFLNWGKGFLGANNALDTPPDTDIQGSLTIPGQAIFTYSDERQNEKDYNFGQSVGTEGLDFNGDGKLDYISLYQLPGQAPVRKLYLSNGTRSDLLTQVTDGYGAQTDFTYKTTVRGRSPDEYGVATYSKGGYTYAGDLRPINMPMYVVSQVAQTNGLSSNGKNRIRYYYQGGAWHGAGRGFLGFNFVKTYDITSGVISNTLYNLALTDYSGPKHYNASLYPINGTVLFNHNVLATSSNINTGAVINTTLNTWQVRAQAAGTRYPINVKSIYSVNNLESSIVYSTVTENSEFNWGRPANSSVKIYIGGAATTGEISAQYTTNYYQTATHRRFGLPHKVTITKSDVPGLISSYFNTLFGESYGGPYPASDPGFKTRTQDFIYFPGKYQLYKSITTGQDGRYLETEYAYDSFGNKTFERISGTDTESTNTFESRESHWQYTADGKFLQRFTNQLGHGEDYVYDARWGSQTSFIGPNGIAVNTEYDNFGRKTVETRVRGAQTFWNYSGCFGTLCHGLENTPKTIVQESVDGAPTVWTVMDILDRPIRKATVALKGQTVMVDSFYNSEGELYRESNPYFEGQSRYLTTRTFDGLGRLISEDQAGNTGLVTVQYQKGGLKTITTNSLGDEDNKTETRYSDIKGQLILVKDHFAKTNGYAYDVYGNQRWIKDANNNITTLSFDGLGNRTQISSPDSGTTSFKVNALGEVREQRDALNQVTLFEYDVLGRLIVRRDGAGSFNESINTWQYDTSPKAGGGSWLSRLHTSMSDGATQSYEYNAEGLVAKVNTRIGIQSFDVEKTYDNFGRLDVQQYPEGIAVKHHYNANGHLYLVEDRDTGTDYWEAFSSNAYGQITTEVLGQTITTVRGYEADTGRLQSILSTSSGQTLQSANYTYFQSGNLKSRRDNLLNVPGIGAYTETFTYDQLNRLKQANTAGFEQMSLTYDNIGNIKSKSDYATQYTYGEGGAGPNALTKVKILSGADISMNYDANGNMISDGDKTIEYTAFNKPAVIEYGSRDEMRFEYNAEQQRVVQENENTTTYYLSPQNGAGAHYEKIREGFSTKHRFYLYGGTGIIGVIERTGLSTENTRFFTRDHLGSVESVLTDSGSALERYVYDAFGERRAISVSSMNPLGTALDADQTRGYTGHEHLDDVGLVHMNARLYDAALGRFISPDAVVAAADNTQGWALYAYVGNNPLGFVDPTGNTRASVLANQKPKQSKFDKYVMPLVTAALAVINPWVAAAFQGTYTVMRTGSLTDGISSALLTFGLSQLMGGVNDLVSQGVSALTDSSVLSVFAPIGLSIAVANSRDGMDTEGYLSMAAQMLVAGMVGSHAGAGAASSDGGAANENTDSVINDHLQLAAADGAIMIDVGQQLGASRTSGVNAQKGPIDLTEHEGVNGSHTIRDHVGKSDQSLLNQMNESADMFGGAVRLYKGQTGSFSSLESANKLVSSTLSTNQELVTEFLDSGRKTLVLNQSFSSPTGRVAFRNGRGSFFRPGRVHFTSGTGVRVVIRRNESFSSGFNVHTAFPTR